MGNSKEILTQSRKRRKEPQRQPCALDGYLNLFKAEFKFIEGCVLAFIPGLRNPRTSISSTESHKRAKHENFENHQHFDYASGSTAYERWQNNLALALSVQAFWQCKLSHQFPGRRFTFFIWNELAAVVDEGERYLAGEIVPALRMWSTENDPDGEMHRSFCVDKSALDVICLRVDYRPVFVPADKVFTRTGALRKSLLTRGAGAGREILS